MAVRGIDKRGNNPVFPALVSAASGALIALAALIGRGVIQAGLSVGNIASPFAVIALALALTGFLLMQLAFRTWHLSTAVPFITGVILLASNILAFFILAEEISSLKWLAIGIVLSGVALMVLSAKKA